LVLPLAVFLIALLPRILSLSAFLTADEDDQIMFANLFLKSALQGDWTGALVLGYPGVPTLILGAIGVGLRYWAHYSGWFPLPWVTTDLMTTLEQVTTRFGTFEHPLDFLMWVRWPMAITAALCVLGIFLLARRLLGEKIALLSVLIIAFDPFILAHTRVIHVDAPLAYFMFLSFLAFVLYLDKGAWKWLLLSGLFGGLAGLSKTPAALLGPILLMSGLFYAVFSLPGQSRAVRWKRLGLALLGWGAIAAAAFFVLFPSMWDDPLQTVWRLVHNVISVNETAHPTTGIFWGDQQSDQNPLYYLIVFPYHLTPLTTVGVVTGLVMILVSLLTRWRIISGASGHIYRTLMRHLPLAMGLVVYVVMFIAPVSAISRRGDRYILPVYFATGLLTALALWWLGSLVKRYLPAFSRRLHLTPTRLGAGAVFAQAFFVLLYHPYYLAYYNPLMGGYGTAPYEVNIGWGEGLDQAAQYLNEITPPNTALVASWYSNQFAPFYHGPTLDLSDQTSALTGDYTVFYINQVQRGFPSKEILAYFQQREPLKVINIDGIDYAWIYKGPVVSQTAPQGYAFAAETIFGGGARLLGVDVSTTTFAADAFSNPVESDDRVGYGHDKMGVPVTLYWETLARIHGEHNVYLRLVDEDGNAWGQIDRLILAGLWRPDRWHSGYFLRDEYRLPIDPATPPGLYHLEVGMYDFVTGQSYGVAKNIGQITLTRPEVLPQPDQLGSELKTNLFTAIDENLSLIGHDFLDSRATPGTEVGGKIFWQATGPISEDYNIQFSLLAPDRKQYVIANLPLSGLYPTSQWRQTETVGTAYRFRVPSTAPAGEYEILATVLHSENEKQVGPFVTLGNLVVEVHKRNFELPQGVAPVSAFVDDEVELVGYKLDEAEVAPEDTFGLTLYWRSLNPIPANYTVFVHAVGPDSVMRGQWDSMPVNGTAPTSGWLPGEVVEDHYEIPMAKDAPAWKYDIFVGMYNPDTGQRLSVTSQFAPVTDNRVWLTRVQVKEE
jgi:4-amino-4-deoxy-L-arabinose transferase-like glycosyltransferase